MTQLPPDLSRLGDQLARATERAAGARRRRTALLSRAGATVAAAAAALAMLAPGALQESDGGLATFVSAGTTASYRPVACDRPRGGSFLAARPCAQPDAPDRRYAVN